MSVARGQSKTVFKAVQLLDVLAGPNPEMGVSELARHLGLSKSVVHTLLATLMLTHLVEQNPETRLYRLGLGAFRLGQAVSNRLTLRTVALPHMSTLARQTDESVHLVVPDGDKGICIEEAVAGSNIRLTFAPGLTGPLHLGASFKAILAFRQPHEIDAYMNGPGLKSGPSGLSDPVAVRADLMEARARGYTVSHGELSPGATAIAAPIFDLRGQVVGSISAAGLTPKIMPKLSKTALQVVAAASEISSILGYQQVAGTQGSTFTGSLPIQEG